MVFTAPLREAGVVCVVLLVNWERGIISPVGSRSRVERSEVWLGT